MTTVFEIEVIRRDTYNIEIDTEIVNPEWIKSFNSYMWNTPFGIRDLANYLATFQARYGRTESFIEGFGEVTRNGELVGRPEDPAAPGFNIVIVDEDNDIETDVLSVTEREGGVSNE